MADETSSGGIRTTAEPASGGTGKATDAAGDPAIDPTQNVLDLVAAAIQRQDDLRGAEKAHIREVLTLRAELAEQDTKCTKEIADLRAQHAQQLREAESARIDAIRAVDVGAVQSAAEVQATQASTLAAQVTTTSDAMRAQTQAAATASATALASALDPIIKDIADLRRAQYEAQGVKAQTTEVRERGGSVGMWVGVATAGFVGLVVVIGTIVTIIATR